jgi:poly-beta-1,6-N-acetyl-D-glucosamine biosynthesis protein PgaD
MGKPGQRYSYPGIIDKPELKSVWTFAAEYGVTSLLWAAWFYWILPVVCALGALLGIPMPYHLASFPLRRVLVDSGVILLAIFALEYAWMMYNYLNVSKIRGERRRKEKVLSRLTLARECDTAPDVLVQLAKCRRIEVSLKDDTCTIVNADRGKYAGEKIRIPGS